MEFETKNYETLVQDQATAIQSEATKLLDKILNFNEGTVLRSLVESNSGVGLWLQGLLVKLLAVTRLASSEGEDVDTFIADYGLTRLDAVKSSGNVTFSRNITTNEARISVGQLVQTSLTSIQFAVIADTSNPNYDINTQQYVIPPGTSFTLAKVEAAVAGASGNVSANEITVITKPINYVDFVNNATPFTTGRDKETDAEVKVRFVLYINSLSKATKLAIEAEVAAVQEGIEYIVVENIGYDTDLERLGYFFVVIDDGTGSPPPELLASVHNAVDRVRGLTTYFEVRAAVPLTANVSATVYVDTDIYDADTIKTLVEDALASFIDGLAIGETLCYTKLAQIIFNASDAIQCVEDILLNGGTNDLTATNKQSIITGTLVITVEDVT